MDGMDGMNHDMSPPSSDGDMHNMMMTHMTFFWGKNGEILFSGWPGTRTGMYVLALMFVFGLSFIVEWLAKCQSTKPSDSSNGGVGAGLVRTAIHGVRMGLAYLVMLALMSFNVGVFLVAIAGHSLGFLLFRSKVFKRSEEKQQPYLPQQRREEEEAIKR